MELDELRHSIGEELSRANKFETFASQCQDQQLKNELQQAAQKGRQDAQKLESFLHQ
jgi:hypothetical protein